MKVTAKWIATECGVSRGTVDRVVNGRGNVAPAVRTQIEAMVEKYGYRTPAQRQAARRGSDPNVIGIIIPSWDQFFTRCIRDGVRAAVAHHRIADVVVQTEELKNRSLRAYLDAIDRLRERGIHALATVPPDTEEMVSVINRLAASGIPVVTFDSDVAKSRRACHIGQDMVKSGRVAAGLLAPYLAGGSVLVVTGNREFRAHGLRVGGFLDRLHEIFDDRVPSTVIECIEQYDLTYQGVLEHVKNNPRLRGIYMANESVRGCMDALDAAGARHLHVVCHDLTPHARTYLEAGRLDFIIDQDFAAQATRAIEVLTQILRTGTPPKQEIEHIAMSIITRELL